MLAIDNSAIVRTISGREFINDPYDQEPKPGTLDFLNAVNSQGHCIYVVTNQGGIAAGFKALDQAVTEQCFILKLFPAISGICMADDYKTSNFWFINRRGKRRVFAPLGIKARKPNPGMLKYLEQSSFKPKLLWMVGDSEEDVNAAESAGWDYLDIEEALKLGKLP